MPEKNYQETEVNKMNDITTTDLSQFGYIERVEARKLLQAWEEQGLPEDFEYEGNYYV